MSLNRSKKRQADPTGQSSRRKKSARALDRRLRIAESEIKRGFRAIPFKRKSVTPLANERTIAYEYQLTPVQLSQLESQITTILNAELQTQDEQPPVGWFWTEEIEAPYHEGTSEETNRINQLIIAAIIAGQIKDPFVQQIPVEQILQSREYREALQRLIIQNYGTISSLSSRTASQVIQQINAGINAGLSPSDIAKSITERFDVSKSSAKRISDTEINRAYNDAKMNATNIIQRRTRQRTGVLHISALLPTTRDTHAARHGKVYTVEDQRRWWDSGTNRINCKCSISTVLIDRSGDVVQVEDQETLIEERKFFERK